MPSSMPSAAKLDVGAIGLTRDDLPDPGQGVVDIGAWFGPERAALPLELEIGSGKGTFIVEQARLQPQHNFLGIEYARAYWRLAADRARRHGLSNVRLLYHDASVFLTSQVAPSSFDRIHIYFPDPWPKARHHKRRLIQAPFLRVLHRVLKPEAVVRIVTDHDEYFQWMQIHLAEVADLFAREDFQPLHWAADGEMVGTNFERKYRREGRRFEGMVLRRVG